MHFIFAVFTFVIVTFVIFIAGQYIFSDTANIKRRLSNLEKREVYSQYEIELTKPFLKRTIFPFFQKASNLITRYSTTASAESLKKKLRMAGSPMGLGASEFVGIKVVLMISFSAMGFFMGLSGGFESGALMTIAGGLLGTIIPDFWLKSKISERKMEIQYEMPDVLDLLTVSVEAGLGFDSAISKVVEKSSGVLASEFKGLLHEIRMGKPRREAMIELKDNVDVEDVSSFVATLVQADQLGVSIGKVLRVQSESMRVKRRQRAQEAALKAPIKMLLPLVFCIFPTLFVVLLGPAIINLIVTFQESGVL